MKQLSSQALTRISCHKNEKQSALVMRGVQGCPHATSLYRKSQPCSAFCGAFISSLSPSAHSKTSVHQYHNTFYIVSASHETNKKMAEFFAVAASMGTISSALIQVPIDTIQSVFFFLMLYGPAGIVIWTFGSREVWQMQMQVLSSPDDADAMNFKQSIQQESSIIAVAVSIGNSRLPKPNP